MFHYLRVNEQDIIEPFCLQNLHEGITMLAKHIINKDKIFIQIDSDVDGYTSAAALINYLNKLFPSFVQNNISYRIHDGKQHGIILDTIPKDVKLVIVPDAGSNDYEQHKILKENGIDVLIIDHHEAETVSQDACVINNQLCNYPNKTLSGVGVVYKFCQGFDQELKKNFADSILDLVAVGMVSDMMDLRDFETRELISLGIHNIQNPFLSRFVIEQSYSLKDEVTPFGISFYIAPYINATIRMGTLDEKMLLFESMLDFKAYEQIPSTKRGYKGTYETRVEQACRNCKNIKNRQTKARDTSLAIIEQKIEEENLLDLPVIIIQLKNPVEENLTGLIANQIMGKYMRPVLLLNRYVDEDENTGEILASGWRGSGRNATYSKLQNFREFLANSGLVEFAQGHASAFGVSITDKQLPLLKEYIAKELADFDFSNCYRVDFIWQYNDAEQNAESVKEIGRLHSLWGQGLQEPYVAIERILVQNNNIVLMSPDKKPTLKIMLPGGLDLIKFNSSQEEYDALCPGLGCTIINIVGTCNLNSWMGNETGQILIEDYEVVGKQAYYF